ncbi:hypothetical protein BC834DRAFT_907471, partial [Gloeopeniophorella convolvens]
MLELQPKCSMCDHAARVRRPSGGNDVSRLGPPRVAKGPELLLGRSSHHRRSPGGL